ncbi:MAG: hypothetical protein ACJA0H_001200 [Francisellaceae bacterium]|jgi:uncharacterized protein (DUF1778 family)
MIKTTRLNFNLPPNKKEDFECAAKMMGVTLTEFAMKAMSTLTKKVVSENHIIEISVANQKKLVDGLLNPKQPNNELKNALEHYNSVMGSK